MASLVKVQYCIVCESKLLEIADTLVYCDDCDFELNREDALPEKMSIHVDKMVSCYNCGKTLKKTKKRLLCANGCGKVRVPIPAEPETSVPAAQAPPSSAEQSRPTQTSAFPSSVGNGICTLTPSEKSTELEARKPTTNGSVPTSPGGADNAIPKPTDSSMQAEQPSADSQSGTKDIKNDLVDSQTSEHAQQTGPLGTRDRQP